MGFSWQEYWSGLPFPTPGGLPNPEKIPWRRPYQTPPALVLLLFFLLFQGWASEWGVQMLSQLIHKEITHNCFTQQQLTQSSVQ